MAIVLHGFDWDRNSSFSRGPAEAPNIIRKWLFSDISSPFSLTGKNVAEIVTRFDFTPLPQSAESARAQIQTRIKNSLQNGHKPLSLGGDHSITFPILQAVREIIGPVNILQIDAHPDLYDELGGDSFSHACPFRRAIEAGCVNNLVQIGLRSLTPETIKFGKKHGVVMLQSDQIESIPYDQLSGPLYITIDLDGFDPAFAPGVSHPEPGGLSTREVLDILKKLPVAPIGADIVELNPRFDHNNITAHLASRLAKELAAMMS